MSGPLGFALDAALGFTLALALVPVAIRLAMASGMNDIPSGWKVHVRPTPQLGGASILVATIGALLLLEGADPPAWEVTAATAVLFALGTADDRYTLRATVRLAAQFAAGACAWAAGIGWQFTGVDVIDLALTLIWVVTLINAFNFLDLMDGVAGATLAMALIAVGAAASLGGEDGLDETAAFVGAGACAGFLVFNLARPSRIFLGDGGTMPLGFLIAAAAMATLRDEPAAVAASAALLIAAVPAGDLIYRVISRIHRRQPLLMAAPDSTANMLLLRMASPRRVTISFALAEALLGGVAVLVVSRF